MGFHVDLESLTSDARSYSKAANTTVESMETAKSSMNKIVTSNAMYGSAGQAVSNDVNNNINAILASLKDEYAIAGQSFQKDVTDFKSAINETSSSAILDEDALTKIGTKLDKMDDDHQKLVTGFKDIFNSIDDIVSLSVPKSNFETGCKTTKKFIKKIITEVHQFDSANGTESQLESLLESTTSQLSAANGKVGLSFSDPSVQGFMANAAFAANIASIDGPIEKGLKKARKEKLKAEKDAKLWAKHHPLEAMWQKAEKAVGQYWASIVKSTNKDKGASWLDKKLTLFTEGAIGSVGKMVGGIVSMAAWCLDTDLEETNLALSTLTGHPDKYSYNDLKSISNTAWKIISNPGQTASAVKNMTLSAVGHVWQDLKTGNAYNIGEDTMDIASMFVGAGELKAGTVVADSSKVIIGKTAKLSKDGIVAAKNAEKVGANKVAYKYYKTLANHMDVSTERNTATFYSGRGQREAAEKFVKMNDKATLESTPGGKYLDKKDLFGRKSPSLLTEKQASEVWSRLSQRYAQNVKGNVYGFVEGADPESIFSSVEYPELLKNPNVTNIFTKLTEKP